MLRWSCSDPQLEDVLADLDYGNRGARQRERCKLPQMSNKYINECLVAAALALRPSGYLFLWGDAYRLCEGRHLAVRNVLPCVELVTWDDQRFGMGYRSRRRGSHLLILQVPPTRTKSWKDKGIPDHWIELLEKDPVHPHVKPPGLMRRLIKSVTKPGDLVIDPAAGTFYTMRIAHELGRRFVGCDLLGMRGESDDPARPERAA